MKLKYKERVSYGGGKTGWDKMVELYPDNPPITNYNETKLFFDELFDKPNYVKDIEFVDIGKKSIIRAKFWRGPFNECPLNFFLESDYSKQFSKHNLLNSVLGTLSKSGFYFIKPNKNEIKIGKMIEVM